MSPVTALIAARFVAEASFDDSQLCLLFLLMIVLNTRELGIF